MTTPKSNKQTLRAVLIDHLDSVSSATVLCGLWLGALLLAGGLFGVIVFVTYRVTELCTP